MTARRSQALARAYRLGVAVLVALLALLVHLRGAESPLLRRLELETLDLRFRLRGPIEPGRQVVLVAIDDSAVAGIGRWPLPRDVIAEAVRRLAAAGAAVIVLDLLFIEPTPHLAPEVREALEQARMALPPAAAEARRRLDEALAAADADARLADAVRTAGPVVLPYAFVLDATRTATAALPPAIRATSYRVYTSTATGSRSAGPPHAVGLLAPTAPLLGAGQSLGSATLLVDVDGALRFALPVIAYEGELYPSLPVEAVRLLAGLAREDVTVRLGEGIDLGGHAVPTDGNMRHYVNYYGPEGTIARLSLLDLLEGRLDPARIRGRIVVLGATAIGTGDRFATPFAERLPGVEHVATVIDNILEGRSIRHGAGTGLVDAIALVAMAGLGAGLAGRRSYLRSLAVALLLVGGWWAIATAAFVAADLWLSVLVPSLAALLAVAIVEGTRIAAEQRRRRRLERQRANLARYFAPSVVERLARADNPAELERTQTAAVMFVDIVGFTRISERMPPRDAMTLLREFHTRVERAVFGHGGMVEKFAGDGTLACFGVPEADPVAAAQALRAARALLADLADWASERGRFGEPAIRAGIGIHHGLVLTGDIGGRQQFQFTVVGDTVNVASRLQAMTREQRADLVISDDAVRAARAAAGDDPTLLAGLEPLPELPLRGREAPIRLWRLARGNQVATTER
jgi:adenylate cyclase